MDQKTCIICAQRFASQKERDEHEEERHFCKDRDDILDCIFSGHDEYVQSCKQRREQQDREIYAGHIGQLNDLHESWNHSMQSIRDNSERLQASRLTSEKAVQHHQTKLLALDMHLDINCQAETKITQQRDVMEIQERKRFMVQKHDRQAQRHQKNLRTYNIFVDGLVSMESMIPSTLKLSDVA